MPDTDWSALKQRCTDHGADLILRAETMDGEVRMSLAAKDAKPPHALIYDQRQNAGDNAPQYVITSLVDAALENWWP